MARIGPRMADVVWYVKQCPGKAMMHYARLVGPNKSLQFGYRTVHRAIKAGLVVKVVGPGNSSLLYPAPCREHTDCKEHPELGIACAVSV